ncbi:MAG: hypothetical protein LC708_03380, partial [Actinobacteria bacterium]|nr:hypothetical protein [Actinomycetota bacterium]
NEGSDSIKGQVGNDDVIGGTGAINGDDPETGTVQAGRLDGAETIDGGPGFDVMTGDNAVIRRVVENGHWLKNTFNDGVQHHPVFLVDINSPDEAVVSGGDTMTGSADDDLAYGQGGGDTVHGNTGSDYLEGNASADTVYGDEGEDDVVGGTGRVNNDLSSGTAGRLDGDDNLYGDTDDGDGTADGSDADVVVGDNSVIERPLVGSGDDEGQWRRNSFNGKLARVIRQLDVAEATTAPAAGTSGGDDVWGSSNDDVLYGQGGNDSVFGGAGDDDIEGNAADDAITGGPGQDDILGGTGPTTSDDAGTAVDGRLDGNDLILGDQAAEDGADDGDGADVVAADNGVITRPLQDGNWKLNAFNGEVARVVTMKDVATTTANAKPGTGGDDTVWGSSNDDVLYGQGGNDQLHGGAGQDDIEGNAANDHVYGDGAEDDLIGGT